MRTREYRYIQWQKDLGRGEIIFQELYDHRTDADEFHNLADDPAHQAICDQLSGWLPKEAAAEFKAKSERSGVREK